VFGLVRQSEYGTNAPYLADFIEICLKVNLLNLAKIREMHEEQGLAASQIASHFGVARSVISARLREMGINPQSGAGRLTDPKNYLCSTAPYGFSVRNGKLVTNKAELRICRMVVSLIQRDGKNMSEVARELTHKKFKNRAGREKWNSKTVFNIYKRWKDKI